MKTTTRNIIIGVVSGLLTFTVIAVVCWQYLDLGGNKTYRDKDFKIEEHYDGTYSLVDVFDSDITELTIPAEVKGKPVTAVSYSAFSNCDKLEKIIFPEHITKISGISKDCTALKEIVIKCEDLDIASATSGAFEKAGVAEGMKITFTSSVKNIPSKTFIKANVKEIVFEEGCDPEWNQGFSDLPKLTKITFASTMESAGSFDNCPALKEVTIPAGVTHSGSFTNCPALTTVNLPEGVKYLGSFLNCTALTRFTIPSTVHDYENDSTETGNISEHFRGCINLTDIYYKGTAEDWCFGTYVRSDSELGSENPDFAKTGVYCTVHCADEDIPIKKSPYN